ncbi:protein of unknown function [Nocardioides alpinus]|uniref:DUF222 domain-containing protein n=1 Tax=Nocardioides alpinus TaxID=748909 RepID=A0A1I1A9U6_9ACTN|nr:DUF222 domain-containing protein [Nocardioides alpinus]PKH43436.1 DUF222 domain-containing protein [Nocardioides alpinus]SFB34707.1 protein of unknown function [Nocardioides alpinus]
MAPTPPPLTAAAIAAMRHEVRASLDGRSGLDDAGRIDAIRALEQLACTVSAAQAALAAELADSVEADHESLGIPAERRGRGVASSIALARRESPHRGQRHLGLARIVRRELPRTWAAWRAGRITEWRATLMARETACLTLEDRLAVDEFVAADQEAFEAMSDRQVIAAAMAEGARLDAEAHVSRRRKAESERRVSMRPAPDTMVWLTALLPVADGVSAYAALLRDADSARAHGDQRSRGQVMADELVRRVTGGAGEVSTEPADRPVALNLVMPHDALLGSSDDPAHLDGFGLIPAELARELVAGAVDAGDELWLRRLYASPTSGELVAMDSRARLFRGGLRLFIRLRDQVCRTPWCNAPIRHADHVVDAAADGPTSGVNAEGLCEARNYAKRAPRWRARPGPDGTVITTTPTGHQHRSRAPALASFTRRDVPRLTVDYVLAT